MLGLTSLSVFLFAALSLAVSSGYSLGAVVLLLASFSLLWKRPRLNLQRQDYLLIAVLLMYFLIYTANMLFHGDPAREVDMPLRALLALPVLLLMMAYPPRPSAWWSGVALGAIGGAALALWQFLVLDMPRPQAATSNAIHYGNVSMLLAMFAMAGLGWAQQQRHRLAWTALLLLACVAGVFGSVISGSRGGWLALPVCLVVAVVHHFKKHGMHYVGAVLLALSALMLLTYFVPHSPIPERLHIAVIELKKFNAKDNAESSIGQRIGMWSNALEMSAQYPLMGMGREAYLAQKKVLVKAGKLSEAIEFHTNAHSDYFDALVKRGAVGLLALLALFLVPLGLFAQALRNGTAIAQPYALAGVNLCICYPIFGLTTSSLTLNIGIIMLVFPMIMLWALLRQQQRPG